jgi:protein gp37
MGTTSIEWAEAVWKPVTGCTPVSAGCRHCYAQRMATRLAGRYGYPAEDPFRVTLHGRMDEPLRWRTPRRVFVCSMGDLFHADVPDEFLLLVWQRMWECPQHTFLVLTKRPERMRQVLAGDFLNPLPNVWLGVSVENQVTAEARIPALLATRAAVRWVSCEPLLGAVDLFQPPVGDPAQYLDGMIWGLDWVVCGGESGPGARPMHPDWARGLRDQCQAAGVAFLFKQWGEWLAPLAARGLQAPTEASDAPGNGIFRFPDGTTMYKVGKGFAGRLLDGRGWDEYPEGVGDRG